MTAAASQHRGALVTSALLLLASGLLMAPAAAAILHQARDRGAALANVGAVLAALGGFGHAAVAMFYLLALALHGGEQAEMVAYVDRINATPAVGAVVLPLNLSFALGVIVLVWAAWRSGVVRIWAPVAATAAVLAQELLPTDVLPVALAIIAVMVGVYAHLGLRVLRSTDLAWGSRPDSRSSVAPIPA
jgi:hypothetical protein